MLFVTRKGGCWRSGGRREREGEKGKEKARRGRKSRGENWEREKKGRKERKTKQKQISLYAIFVQTFSSSLFLLGVAVGISEETETVK